MSNQYILYMSQTPLASPVAHEQIATITSRWDAQVYTNVLEARALARPLVAFYGLTVCADDVDSELRRHGAGACALVAKDEHKKRYLYILKIDDHHQTTKRRLVGK